MKPTLYNRFIQWICDSVWPSVDPQLYKLLIQLDITNSCNLTCDHCYLPHHKNIGALTFQQWLSVLDQYEALLRKLRMLSNVTLCGGEIMLCPFLIPLLTDIRRRFPQGDLNIQSNGTLVTHELAAQFSKLNLDVMISLDGPDAHRNDSIRGKGSFDKVMRGCQILREHDVPFYHQAVLSRRTLPWITDFFTIAQQTGATAMNFTRLIVEGHAKTLLATGNDSPLEGSGLKKALQQIWECSKTFHVPTRTTGPLWHLIDSRLGSFGGFGYAGVVIGYRGEVKVSSRAQVVLGNVFQEGLETLFLKHPVMKRLRSTDIAICGACDHFKKCGGNRNASFARYGHLFGPDPGCWLLTKEQIDQAY